MRWLQLPIRPQAWLHGHRVDFLIGDRLVVQIDGKQHEKAQRVSDRAHDAELMKRGYFVIRVGYAEVVYDWSTVETVILDAVARKLHLAR
ncbi:endonuclease domain-containing protein [Leucobacter sp. HY1910]